MKAPGVLVNLRAGRVRRDPSLVHRLEQLVPRGHLEATTELEQLPSALKRLRDAGVETLAVVGGDGTTPWTLTALLRVWPSEKRPALLLLAGGTINTVPHSVSGRGRPDRILARLGGRGPALVPTYRSVLRVEAAGEPPTYGMIFANGTAPRWLLHYNSGTYKGVLGAAGGVIRSLGSIALGGPLARELFAPFAAEIEVDGEVLFEQRFTAMAAGAVQHIGLGFKPFLSIPREGRAGRFHWVTTASGGIGLAMELPAVRFGIRPPLTALRHNSARSVRIRLTAPEPFTVDGDLFRPARDLRIDAGPPLCFLSADGALR